MTLTKAEHRVIYRTWRYLTITQAEQVNREYPSHSDHSQYEYAIDHTGRVVDRYWLPPTQRPQ